VLQHFNQAQVLGSYSCVPCALLHDADLSKLFAQKELIVNVGPTFQCQSLQLDELALTP
jgi:hypothetical protein